MPSYKSIITFGLIAPLVLAAPLSVPSLQLLNGRQNNGAAKGNGATGATGGKGATGGATGTKAAGGAAGGATGGAAGGATGGSCQALVDGINANIGLQRQEQSQLAAVQKIVDGGGDQQTFQAAKTKFVSVVNQGIDQRKKNQALAGPNSPAAAGLTTVAGAQAGELKAVQSLTGNKATDDAVFASLAPMFSGGIAQNTKNAAAAGTGCKAAGGAGASTTGGAGNGAKGNTGNGAASNTGNGAAANTGNGAKANTGNGAKANTGNGAGGNTGNGAKNTQ